MKTALKLFCLTVILFSTTLNSFSIPLNGSYTVGSGGTYTTINSALDDAMSQGIIGPVIFDIITGVYNERILGNKIFPGSSIINTVTLKSQSGNSTDVIFTSDASVFSIFAADMIFRDLTINLPFILYLKKNVSFININFSGYQYLEVDGDQLVPSYDLNIIGCQNNFNLFFISGYLINNIQIKNNNLGIIEIYVPLENGLVENNIFSDRIELLSNITNVKFIKNKIVFIFGDRPTNAEFYNNFITGLVEVHGNFINNTVLGGGSDLPALLSLNGCKNNIIINAYGGPAVSQDFGTANSDYNVFYNGGNSNLIIYHGISFDNVQDFYNATGLDHHSSNQQVNFVSPADLHLTGSSLGDLQLACIPDSSITDDIDGQPRNPYRPYKGADEVVDYPLPVELVSFSSSVTNNNVQLIWTTSYEANNSGFEVERRNINREVQSEWIRAGYVKGNGNSNVRNNFTFAEKVNTGKYNYRLKQIDFNGNYKYYDLSSEVDIGIPDSYNISQNYPNPFNPSTKIDFELPHDGIVNIILYDISGREVATFMNEVKTAGYYIVNFNASNLSSGMYIYRITADKFVESKRMMLIK